MTRHATLPPLAAPSLEEPKLSQSARSSTDRSKRHLFTPQSPQRDRPTPRPPTTPKIFLAKGPVQAFEAARANGLKQLMPPTDAKASKDTCHGREMDPSAMRRWSPVLNIPHSLAATTPEMSRQLLNRLRDRDAREPALGGHACQSEMQERWAEMRAWCGFLATNLEGACCRIEQLGEEARVADRAHGENQTTIQKLEERSSEHNVGKLERKIELMQAELRDRDHTIEGLKQDLREGKKVDLSEDNAELVNGVVADTLKDLGLAATEIDNKPEEEDKQKSPGLRKMKRMITATRIALLAASQAKSEHEKTQEEIFAEDEAAMPSWNMEAWLGSLDMQSIVTNSVLDHVRNCGGEINPSVELLFMQKLARVGSRDTVLALLRASSMLDDITDRLWAGILKLQEDMEEEERLVKKQKEDEEERRFQAQLLEQERAQMLEAYDNMPDQEEQLTAEETDALLERELNSWKGDLEAKEKEREAAKQAREEGRKAAADEAEAERVALLKRLEDSKHETDAAKNALDEVSKKGATADELSALQARLEEMAQEAEAARSLLDQQQEKENERLRKEAEAEAEAERLANEQRVSDEAKRPKRWDVVRADAKLKKKKRMIKYMLEKPDAKAMNEAIKIDNPKAFNLSYATPDVYFRGLAKVVGRAGTDAGNDSELMILMEREHCHSIDSMATFEPPNFVIPTTSRIEWWAVKDPEKGLEVLGLPDWPKEARVAAGHARHLHPPRHFKPGWDSMNFKLEEIGEGPLQMSGFCCLRLYTGPMYFKYNNVLRGVSVPGCKAPLEHVFMKLCQGNKYTNTMHCIAAAINKLSRVTVATKVYRAPGGILPKSFWENDKAGIKGGVEMGFMSTSRSQKAAMDYAKMSGVKLIFEFQQGMVARGADVSWLSMYPNEDEVLFAPLTACEVQKTRIDGSVLVVELTPGAAPASLTEKSIEEKEEEDRIEREKAEAEATARKKRIEEVATTRAQWLNSMADVKVSAERVKKQKAELEAAENATLAASESERANLAEQEKAKADETLKAMRELKKMELEEREAAKKKAEAESAHRNKLTKAKEMGEFIKKAALRQRLAEEQESLKKLIVENQAEREREEVARQALAARALATAVSAQKAKGSAGEEVIILRKQVSDGATREAELNDRLQNSLKKMMQAEKEMHEAQQLYKEANTEFKVEEVAETQRVKDPLEMGEKLEGWLNDPKTAVSTSIKISQMCKKDAATNRKKFLSLGAIEKLVRSMAANPDDCTLQEACCAALATLTGAPGAGKKAFEAGALPVVVRSLKTLHRSGIKALLSITAGDPDMIAAAKEAGAKDDWFIQKTEGEEEGGPESPNKSGGKKLEKQETAAKLG